MKNALSLAIIALFCTGLGLAGGWFVSMQKGQNSQAQEAEAEHHGDGQKLSQAAMQNLGIVVHPARLSTFFKYETVPAVIEELPTTSYPVFAPVNGHVDEILVEKNSVAEQRRVLLTLIRDALPRVNLTLTGEILKPATEEFHQSLANFRRAAKNLEILQKEAKRIAKYARGKGDGEFPIVPQKRLIEIRYEIDKAQHEVNISKEELIRHGLSTQQIAADKLGQLPRVDVRIWNKALQHHGLWPNIAEKIYDALPKDMQQLHWTMATIGELVAAGLATKDLEQWLRRDPKVGAHFLEIGGLLQRGNTLAKIQHLYELNGFQPIVRVQAPAGEDWDVDDIAVKHHQSVEEGERLFTLKNSRELFLIAQPEGSEKNTILQALRENLPLQATPLLTGEGPELKDLRLFNVVNDENTGKTRAYIKVQNEVLHIYRHHNGAKFRSWRLRRKMSYVLRVPTQKMEKVYVLSRDAISEDGANTVVFLQNGDTFRPIEVVVLYQDEEVAVISGNSDIFPGDPIVHKGAFALGLALKSGTDKAGSGHGHGHGHGH